MDAVLMWMESHQGLASWAQAIGALIALVIAIWLPAHQHNQATRLMREQRELEVRNLMGSFAAMADWGTRTFEKFDAILQQEDVVGKISKSYIPEAHERIGRIFEGFPYHNLPSYDLTKHAMEVRDAAFFVNSNIHIAATNMIDGTINLAHFRGYYPEQVAVYRKLVERYHQLMAQYIADAR